MNMGNFVCVAPEKMESIFPEYLKDERFLFVFPTDVVMNSWIDWCVTHEEESGISAVPLERFTAWDKFKQEYVAAKETGKTAIPAILRKLFIRQVIQENAQNPFFKVLINPDYAENATSFTDWLTKMLPSLSLWYKLQSQNGFEDEEDQDFLCLYQKYDAFLQKNDFFEPAWTVPDFSGTGKKILIIYPEVLEDFADYKPVFDQCPDITLITFPKDSKPARPKCYKYTDSRKELRRTILQIRELVEQKKAQWQDITLNVPDLETYRPYLERELTQYCVPFVIRAGFPLTSNCAGVVFPEIFECFSSDFSYDAVRALLLNNYIPWKKEFDILKENLIREGQRMRCICGYNNGAKKIDIWEEALSKIKEDYREYQFYLRLKKDITAICKAGSFSAIHSAWMVFKQQYLEEADFSEDADKIISRCITELNALINIEEEFFQRLGLSLSSPYEFFINELNSKSYTPQNQAVGIAVYPYRLSAAGAFKYQFVIDASQKNLELPFKRLSFLNTRKRQLLKLTDDDKIFNASQAFISLYAKSNQSELVQFSYAEESFAGFAIAHTYLDLLSDKDPLAQLDSKDFIRNEKNWFLSGNEKADFAFTQAQKEQFEHWTTINKKDALVPYSVSPALKEKIDYVLIKNRNPDGGNKIVISQSDMKNYFPCPRKWLFSNVLQLEEESLETSLMQPYDIGNINHEILEHFCQHFKENDQTIPQYSVFEETDCADIKNLLTQIIDKTIHNPKADFHDSPLVISMLEAQASLILENIFEFIKEFCKKYGGYKVKGVETWYRGADEQRDWEYTGKIDCLLVNGSNEDSDSGWTIIDYKNTVGSVPSAGAATADDTGNLADFQIAMYVTLVRENECVQDIDNAAFFAIKERKQTVIIDKSNAKKNQESFNPTLEAFNNYAETFHKNIMANDFSLTDVDVYEDCPGCSYRSICRLNYTVAGRRK